LLEKIPCTAMPNWITMGQVSGLYGVKGWVKVFSYSEPRQGIIDYNPLYLAIGGEWQPLQVEEACPHGKGIILRFAGYTNRDEASALLGCDIAVLREQLPPLGPGQYYWADLQGLQVINLEGVALGSVAYLFATGANDVVVVKGERERLIPFLQGDVIMAVDLEKGVMWVDWSPEY
jgi:16S rRNA processing protein RimM